MHVGYGNGSVSITVNDKTYVGRGIARKFQLSDLEKQLTEELNVAADRHEAFEKSLLLVAKDIHLENQEVDG